jgi:hypothetical protein
VLERCLGSDFHRLHPLLQQQYALCSNSQRACIGHGVMERVWRGPFYMWPFLYLGSLRRIMFTDIGQDVPFTIENYAYRDGYGRETLSWTRMFAFRRPRRFDEWMIFSERRRCMLIYAGTRQHLAVEVAASVGEGGALVLRTGAQRLNFGPLRFRQPRFLSGAADVREWYNERAAYFEIDVHVAHPFWGPIFGYRGRFQLEWIECPPERIPAHARPLREERHE